METKKPLWRTRTVLRKPDSNDQIYPISYVRADTIQEAVEVWLEMMKAHQDCKLISVSFTPVESE